MAIAAWVSASVLLISENEPNFLPWLKFCGMSLVAPPALGRKMVFWLGVDNFLVWRRVFPRT